MLRAFDVRMLNKSWAQIIEGLQARQLLYTFNKRFKISSKNQTNKKHDNDRNIIIYNIIPIYLYTHGHDQVACFNMNSFTVQMKPYTCN